MIKKLYLLVCILGLLLVTQAKGQEYSKKTYSIKVQNISSPDDISGLKVYLTKICEAAKVEYNEVSGEFVIETSKNLERNIIAGKLQKKFAPMLEFKLEKSENLAAEIDTREPYEIVNSLEQIHEGPDNDFSTAKTITLNFTPFEKVLPSEIESKIKENMAAYSRKIEIVSITNGSIVFKYINQSPKEIMMIFKEKELPSLFYEASLNKYTLVYNHIEKL